MSGPSLVRSAVALAMMVATAQAAPDDPGWPRDYATGAGHQLRLYQPQFASWDGQTRLVAYVAVAETQGDGGHPQPGSPGRRGQPPGGPGQHHGQQDQTGNQHRVTRLPPYT
jgi:hypothetical protein